MRTTILSMFLGALLVTSLTSCVVPSYGVPTYAGSLDKCLDIYGTYEIIPTLKYKNARGFNYLILPDIYIKKMGRQESALLMLQEKGNLLRYGYALQKSITM